MSTSVETTRAAADAGAHGLTAVLDFLVTQEQLRVTFLTAALGPPLYWRRTR